MSHRYTGQLFRAGADLVAFQIADIANVKLRKKMYPERITPFKFTLFPTEYNPTKPSTPIQNNFSRTSR